ncbi:hypothetical protein [Candidatus Tisiphia endosymbiont of Nemotelus uliginosus]|uniref:hypothetical protein n=1 Tax=Candidatus Tisiphia endosymbiont of Nemotelus uliginosus TaxID=3077926 RepID=UPI0035C88BB1
MTSKTDKKAIIFLEPPYGPASHQLRQDIVAVSKKNKLTILKIIQAKGVHDSLAFYKLINRVISWRTKPVTIIIDKVLFNSPLNLLLCCILGTLSATGLITICTYNIDYSGLKLQFLNKQESNLLYVAAGYFKRILPLITSER